MTISCELLPLLLLCVLYVYYYSHILLALHHTLYPHCLISLKYFALHLKVIYIILSSLPTIFSLLILHVHTSMSPYSKQLILFHIYYSICQMSISIYYKINCKTFFIFIFFMYTALHYYNAMSGTMSLFKCLFNFNCSSLLQCYVRHNVIIQMSL